jgi:hypothetical protein
MKDRKLLKREYKDTIQPMGIYRITNKANGRFFVGASLNLKGAFNSATFQLDYGMHRNWELQAAYTEFGKENFVFEVLDHLPPKEDPAYDYSGDLKVLEEMWLDKLQPYGERGYNREKTGSPPSE